MDNQTPSGRRFDRAVFAGRCDPPHRLHEKILRLAAEVADEVDVFLGSAFQARTPKNPLTWQEIKAALECVIPPADFERMHFYPIRDYYNQARWVAEVKSAVAAHGAHSQRVALVGCFKDHSSEYLRDFSEWEMVEVQHEVGFDSTTVRDVMFDAEDVRVALASLTEVVSEPIRQFLLSWSRQPIFTQLREDYFAIRKIHEMYRGLSEMPIQLAADALITCQDHVLLVQRARAPGRGLWALPGGRLEAHETLLQCALRELKEETGLGTLASLLEQALVSVKTYDHPLRDPRGRYVSQVHHFDLQSSHLPELGRASTEPDADDAMNRQWVPFANLRAMENEFFADHFRILDNTLLAL